MRVKFFVITVLMLLCAVSFADVKAYVSILPQKYFLEQIGGSKVHVRVMVMPGAEPATYEPRPRQMVELSKTDLYFAIGVPFEKAWLSKFRNINKKMTIVMTDDGIKRRDMVAHVHMKKENSKENIHEEHSKRGSKDPHIWLDPVLVIKQVQNMTAALCKADPANCQHYEAGRDHLVLKVEKLDNEIKTVLWKHKGAYFMVFHPSWGYFAERYGIHQIPVELEGKEPKPSELKSFIDMARKLKLKAIFISPQFPKRDIKLIARETGASVADIDPLALDWDQNLLHVAKLIAGTFQGQK